MNSMPQILFAAVNFLVLVVVLYILLGKPVRQLLESRQIEIEAIQKQAEEARQEAAQQKLTIEDRLNKVDIKVQEVIAQAQQVSEVTKTNLIQQGKEQADQMQLATKEEIRLELEKAKQELRSNVAELSILATSQLLQEAMQEKDHEALIEDFIRDLGQTS